MKKYKIGDVVDITDGVDTHRSLVVQDNTKVFIVGIYVDCRNTGEVRNWEVKKVKSFKELQDGEGYTNVEVSRKVGN